MPDSTVYTSAPRLRDLIGDGPRPSTSNDGASTVGRPAWIDFSPATSAANEVDSEGRDHSWRSAPVNNDRQDTADAKVRRQKSRRHSDQTPGDILRR